MSVIQFEPLPLGTKEVPKELLVSEDKTILMYRQGMKEESKVHDYWIPLVKEYGVRKGKRVRYLGIDQDVLGECLRAYVESLRKWPAQNHFRPYLTTSLKRAYTNEIRNVRGRYNVYHEFLCAIQELIDSGFSKSESITIVFDWYQSDIPRILKKLKLTSKNELKLRVARDIDRGIYKKIGFMSLDAPVYNEEGKESCLLDIIKGLPTDDEDVCEQVCNKIALEEYRAIWEKAKGKLGQAEIMAYEYVEVRKLGDQHEYAKKFGVEDYNVSRYIKKARQAIQYKLHTRGWQK
jgi:DNA-directed RNA polymerase specialized sigma24 family protein